MTVPHRRRTIFFALYKAQQARVSRKRLYKLSLLYYGYAIVVSILAVRSAHARMALGFLASSVPVWTLVEYLTHRFILHGWYPDDQEIILIAGKRRYRFFLHGRFPYIERLVQRYLHTTLDPLHWQHHWTPYDGDHISGELHDLLPLFLVAAPLSFIAPVYTLPVFLAGIVASYVTEEWIHHSVHFYNFRDPYFRYLRRHHFYHHSPKGMEQGYGLTSGFWDMVFGTSFSREVRHALYRKHENPR